MWALHVTEIPQYERNTVKNPQFWSTHMPWGVQVWTGYPLYQVRQCGLLPWGQHRRVMSWAALFASPFFSVSILCKIGILSLTSLVECIDRVTKNAMYYCVCWRGCDCALEMEPSGICKSWRFIPFITTKQVNPKATERYSGNFYVVLQRFHDHSCLKRSCYKLCKF